MDWQKKEITKSIVSLVISSLLSLWALLMIIGITIYNGGSFAKGSLIFIVMLGFFLLIVWTNYKSLKESIDKYNKSKDSELPEKLKKLNPYKSQEEMRSAFYSERQSSVFQDNDFVITQCFFVSSKKDTVFYINGILDVKPVVHMVNGIIDYVTLFILYYDGKKYEFKFRRPLGISNMQEKANKIEFVANIIASNSDNFRKYPDCQF